MARYSVRGPRSCWRDRLRAPGSLARRARSAMETSRVDAEALAAGLRLFDEGGRVDDQSDPLIAELAGAGEAADALEGGAEGLDDHVLLADQGAHHQAEPARAD